MKPLRKYLIAIVAVTLWGGFSYAYIGVEDGSSGLSILGLLHAIFIIPGGFIFHVVKGSHSNADIPVMAGISWFVYVLVSVLVVKCVCIFRKNINRSKSNDGSNV